MRKIVFTIVGSMLISLCAVQAQQSDTTGTASKSKSKQSKYKTEQSSKDRNKSNKDQAWQQQSDRMRGHDQALVIIDVQEVPSNIKQKLEADEKYSGWEKATVYHNTNTGDYIIIPQPFRFDKEGNEKEMTGGQAWGQNRRQMSQQHQGMSRQDQSQQNEDMSSQEQAQNQMGEIPTSASQDQSGDQSAGDQQQSNSYRTEQDQQQNQPGDQQQNSQGYRTDDSQYSTANMVEVQEDQIPESLRTALQESEYEGWKESGKLYRNPSTSEYVLIIDKSDNASQERRYRFDANGERVDE